MNQMSSDQGPAIGGASGGQGKLAELIAHRGGVAAPETPFVIEHREALIYMLCQAAELEHGIMCQYLFAAFSLKQGEDEGLSGTELDTVRAWRKHVSHIATQEMLHLALVQNVLSAIGAAPHTSRPNLPVPASHYPAGVQMALLPFGEQALRHFMFLERPEGMDLDDADGLAAVAWAKPVMSEQDLVPRGQDFATIGHLYRSIEAGLARLAEKHGEDWLFVGPPRAQATSRNFGWPELVAVTDLSSATSRSTRSWNRARDLLATGATRISVSLSTYSMSTSDCGTPIRISSPSARSWQLTSVGPSATWTCR
jgi:hypothetical protein